MRLLPPSSYAHFHSFDLYPARQSQAILRVSARPSCFSALRPRNGAAQAPLLARFPMSFGLYLIGFVIVIAGVAWGMSFAGIPTTWVLITCVILLGIGILTAVTNERSKDRP